MDYGIKIDIKTYKDGNDLVIRTTEKDLMSKWINNVIEKRINLEEEAVREALVKLGWTPPKED